MALDQYKAVFGTGGITIIDPDDNTPVFVGKLVGQASVKSNQETVNLKSGPFRGNVQVEPGERADEVSITLHETHPKLFEYFAGVATTSYAAEPNGSVSTLANMKGTSVMSATTGIASISLESGQSDKLVDTGVTIKAVSSTTVDVYMDTAPPDWYVSSSGATPFKINPTPITVTTGAVIVITNNLGNKTGLQITGGSGAIAFTTGNTAIADCRKPNTGRFKGTVGRGSEVLKRFKMVIEGALQKSGRNARVTCHSCSPPGISVNFNRMEFAENELTIPLEYVAKANVDGSDGVWDFEYIDTKS